MDPAPPPAFTRWSRDARIGARTVSFRVDGRPLEGFEGECLVVALGASGVLALRCSPAAGTPRGAFCLMGVCQECVVVVDGELVPACAEPVRAGMDVVTDSLRRRFAGAPDV
jgi:D-hydroxyproline dehydrogenase subunit gamma